MKTDISQMHTMALFNVSQPNLTKAQNLQGQNMIAEKKINSAAHEFEAVFVSEMMKPMFEGLKTDGMFGGGQAEEIFRSVMLQEYGKMVAQTDRIGIAPKVREAMIQMQEQQSNKKG